MNIETLLGSFAGRLNRDLMQFPATSANLRLPGADASRTYLLYLHVPFCAALCPFCTFHRVLFERDTASQYFGALRREVELATAQGYVFDELYVGGGTPTVLPDELVETLRQLRAAHAIRNISVETNPDHLRADALQALRDAGVSRLSVGVQSFDDGLLRAMRRFDKYGSGAEIAARLRKSLGIFDTLNIDMIFNLPQQTEAMLRRDLDTLVDEVEAAQVSFYPLMVTDVAGSEIRRAMGEFSRDREKRYYEIIVERMLAAGYQRSSAWCFSRRPGMFDEYIVGREEYLGLGSGAFSYLDGTMYSSTFSIPGYLQRVAAGESGTAAARALTQQDQLRYYLLMQLFAGRLDKQQAEARFGGRFESELRLEITALRALRMIRDSGSALELTEQGYYLWVVLMREFFSGINQLREQMRHRRPV